ncbi:MAG: murein biosynthesis integral membrane protein MurJ [bacterium]
MFKKIITGKSKTIVSAAVVIGAASLASRFLGLFRDRILAGTFNAGTELDIYFAAFRLPDLVYNLLVLGALSAGFIPVFVGYINNHTCTKDNKEAWRLANNILNILAIALVCLCLILIIFAPLLVKIVAPGFTGEQSIITTKMIQIMMASPILLGLSSVFGGILQSFKRFFIYSLAPIFYNIGIIIGALYFVKFWGIYGLAWGVVFGASLHFINQMAASFFLGYRYKKIIDLKDRGTRKILKMMPPRTLTLAVTQINLLVITAIASTLKDGSISIFNFANNLQGFPIGIFGVSFAIAVFPTLSELAAQNNKEEFIKNFSITFRQILFFVIPISFFLIVLRAQTVRIVYGTGKFDWNSTILTMNTLAFFCLSLFSQSLSPILVRGFYAYHDSRTPLYVAIIGVCVNIILSLFFTSYFNLGVIGLALAFSVASWCNMGLLFLTLRMKMKRLDGRKISWTAAKIVFAAATATFVAQIYKFIIGPITGTETLIRLLLQASIVGAIGFWVYGALCWILRVEEIFVFFASLKRKFLRLKHLQAVNIREEEDLS